MRILFSTTPLEGHFRPLVPLARALQARGHEVAFATHASWHPHVEAAGFAALAAGIDHAAARAGPFSAVQEELARRPPLERRRYAFAHLFGEGHAPAKLPHLLELTRTWGPDLLVHETADLASPVAARAAGVPVVHHGFGTMISHSILRYGAAAVAPLWRSAGLDPDPYAGAFTGLYVDVVPPGLDGDRPLGDSVRLRLPLLADDEPPAWLEELGAPLVYVTLGTAFNDPPTFRPLLEALAGEPVWALVTIGRDGVASALGAIPPNVRVERYVPQAHVLPRCAAVVTHGGSGTTLGALAAGVPLVVVPQGADQFENAVRCERVGVGVVVLPDALTADAVRAALRQVLHDPGPRVRAQELAAELASLPSPDDVAGTVEAWVEAWGGRR